jgi:lipopolysaccharide/colanic/teichoic acid biosynthesis glycosyltransferase
VREGAASFVTVWPAGRQLDAAPDGTDWGARLDRAETLLAEGKAVVLPAADVPTLARAFGASGSPLPSLVLAPRPPSSRALRRVLDLAIALPLMIVLSPLFALLAVLVKLSSPGPVLFRARVTGGGRAFEWYKFRTMRAADPAREAARREAFDAFARGGRGDATDFKVVEEDRVTPLGRLLRRHSLDELPQLWNVLVGDMALVGPRPCLEYESEHYEGWRRRRLEIMPGLTGLWQVYGRSRVPFEEAVVMDIIYGMVRSTALDLSLIARTVMVVLRGEGGR